jgi:uncharacterized protein YjbJ (UPF0337 family)
MTMVNFQMLQGKWSEISGSLRERWGQLTDDELDSARGNVDQLIGLIQRKTGESREAIERYIDKLTTSGAEAGRQYVEQGRRFGQQLSEAGREYSEQAQRQIRQLSSGARQAYAQAESMVQQRPAQSMGVVFAVGAVAGLLVGMMLRGRS